MSAFPFLSTCLTSRCFLLLVVLTLLLRVSDSRAAHLEKRSERALPGDDEEPVAVSRASIDLDAYDELPDEELDEEYVEINVTAEKWKYLGSPCDGTCNPSLQHVYCNPNTFFCECEKLYPVQLGPTKGCAKAKKLGEQCLYRATCIYTDQHSTCTQVQHNAVCECELGYHRVTLSKPNKRLFCAADLVLIATDLPTLLGVASGIAVLTGLICFVLKLFSRARYTRPRHYANAGHVPAAMLFTSDTGIPLTMHGRPSSRSSQRSSGGTINCSGLPRKQSSNIGADGTRGPLVPSSRAGAARAAAILLISCQGRKQQQNGENGAGKHRRALSDVPEASPDGLGSRRPSLASIHSTTSSAKSYSNWRFERERNEKEHRQAERQALVDLKLRREQQQHHQQQQQQQQQQQKDQQQQPAPTPSPRTPHSTDELLPSVEEGSELFYNEQVPTTSGVKSVPLSNSKATTSAAAMATSEAVTPLFESDAKPCTSTEIFRT